MYKYVLIILCVLLLAGCTQDEPLEINIENNKSYTDSTPPLDVDDSWTQENEVSHLLSDDFIPSTDADGVIEIKEKMFIAQSNDIYLNPEDYIGKTIKYEGLFKPSYWEDEDETFYFVIRYGPGCCGYDGEAGFEITWDGAMPKEDDWCEVVGKLEVYEVDNMPFLRLAAHSLTVLDVRGEEFVYQ